MLKVLTRSSTVLAAIIAGGAFAGPALAYTQNGNIPAAVAGHPDSGTAQIHLQQPIPKNTGYVKLTLKIPQVLSLGIHYSVAFCVGPTSNCFAATQAASASIPGGQQITVIYKSEAFTANHIWVGHGTAAPVPYTLEVDYL